MNPNDIAQLIEQIERLARLAAAAGISPAALAVIVFGKLLFTR